MQYHCYCACNRNIYLISKNYGIGRKIIGIRNRKMLATSHHYSIIFPKSDFFLKTFSFSGRDCERKTLEKKHQHRAIVVRDVIVVSINRLSLYLSRRSNAILADSPVPGSHIARWRLSQRTIRSGSRKAEEKIKPRWKFYL